MTWAARTVAIVALGLGAGLSARGAQEATFRATTDAVTADVLVRAGGKPVTGLSAEDFTVLDNGAAQRVERADAVNVPVDVTLLVDVAEPASIWNPSQIWWGKPHSSSQVLAQLHAIVRASVSVLHAEDRIGVIAVDSYVQLAMPMQPASATVRINAVESGGQSSLYDALAIALMRRSEPGRRHLVIAVHTVDDFDTGAVDDTISTAAPLSLQEIARRGNGVLHVIAGDSLVDRAACDIVHPAQPPGEPSCRLPMRHLWRAAGPRSLPLAQLAALTGGEFHGTNPLGFERDVVGTITNILSEFRQGYVLRYSPRNVPRAGWHQIEVTVPGRPGVTVHARRGYSVELPTASLPGTAAAPSAGRTASARTPIASLASAFEHGDAMPLQKMMPTGRDAVRLLRDLREAPSLWPSRPRQDALFVLEVGVAALRSADAQIHDEALKLLEHYGVLVRGSFDADEFECLWYRAEIAGLEGAIRPAGVSSFVDRARARCPDQARFTLAAAFLVDQQWPLGTTAPLPGPNGFTPPRTADPARVRAVIAGYEAAMQAPDTAVEARVRLAWFLYRVGRYPDASRYLDQLAGLNADRQIAYFAHLVQGHVRRALGEHARAVDEFSAALDAWPGAQAPRVALMTLLVGRGDLDRAQKLAELVQTAPDGQVDPWWMYWQGDYWAYPAMVARLRELAK